MKLGLSLEQARRFTLAGCSIKSGSRQSWRRFRSHMIAEAVLHSLKQNCERPRQPIYARNAGERVLS